MKKKKQHLIVFNSYFSCIENDVNFRAIQEMLKDHEVKLNHLVQTKQVLLNGIQASKMAMDNVPQQKIVVNIEWHL